MSAAARIRKESQLAGTRIVVADDHRLMRQGLRTMLTSQGFEVVGEAQDGRTAVAMACELAADLVIMDITMPGLNGIDATRQITDSAGNGAKVIALSMHSDRRFVAQALKAGASGYLLKDCAFDELAQAIQAVLAGKVYLSPGVTGAVVDDYLRKVPTADTGRCANLTAREREVLQLLAEGSSTKQIAAALKVSTKTVETYRRRVMDKLNLYTVAELTKYAIREGLTSTG